MAFIDQTTDRNQRAAVMTVVAVIQGAAIVALINGLAVTFLKPPAVPNPQATDSAMTLPLPTPIPPPPPRPPIEQRERPETPPPLPLPPNPYGQATDPAIPLPPDPMPTQTANPIPLPSSPPPMATRPAKPRNAPDSWATSNDYPARDLREGNQGATRFALAIGPDGRVQACAVTGSSGFPSLDKAACDNISRRARFEPATDGTGARIAGSYRGTIHWVIPKG